MEVTIKRFDSSVLEYNKYDTFHLDISVKDGYTVMDILQKIYYEYDSSLAFFSHSTCNHGICGRCAVKLDGRVRLACTEIVSEEKILIEPKNNLVIRDLMCK